MTAAALTVDCDGHDQPMVYDPVWFWWRCPVTGCTARLTDEDAARLTCDWRPGQPPVPVRVT